MIFCFVLFRFYHFARCCASCIVLSEQIKMVMMMMMMMVNWLTYAKSTGELISLDSAIAQSEVWFQRNAEVNRSVQTKKNDFIFWLIFGLSPNLGLSEKLSERLIQKVKRPIVSCFSQTSTSSDWSRSSRFPAGATRNVLFQWRGCSSCVVASVTSPTRRSHPRCSSTAGKTSTTTLLSTKPTASAILCAQRF